MPLLARLYFVPYGDMARAELIGELKITNDGSGDVGHGNYEALLEERRLPQPPSRQACYVHRFDRSQGAWALVKEVLTRMRP